MTRIKSKKPESFTKYFILCILIVFSILSCSEIMEKPKNLLSEEKMANVIVDFAINDQGMMMNLHPDNENATRFILKKYKISGENFSESYKYYMTKPETMKNILNKAEEIIKQKDPKAEEYINKKIKKNQKSLDKN